VLKHEPLKIQNYAGKFPRIFQMGTDPAMVYTRCCASFFFRFVIPIISLNFFSPFFDIILNANSVNIKRKTTKAIKVGIINEIIISFSFVNNAIENPMIGNKNIIDNITRKAL
jgi:hypothetical protein